MWEDLKIHGERGEYLYHEWLQLRRLAFIVIVMVFDDYPVVKYVMCLSYIGLIVITNA